MKDIPASIPDGLEIQAIEAVLDRYFQGIYLGDTALLKSVFHPQATLFGEIRGAPYQKSADEYIGGVGNRKSPHAAGEDFNMKTLSINVAHTLASAKVHCPFMDFNYVNFLSLVKYDDRWLIVNKILTDIPLLAAG
ncbi:MAG: nuclear transport factor 2 family protein [Collimonas sp.]|uniref:nuclear transport factor 2 family protein n=1 Tax=Collimonas sp. TaxID=1963772 RepID=UPI0032661710